VLFDVEHQICQGAESVPEVHEAAFEVAANDMLGPDQRHLSGERAQFKAALVIKGERQLVVVREVPLVQQCLPFGEVVETAEDGFQHRQRRDLRTGDLDEHA
jgi:hypothetical protein